MSSTHASLAVTSLAQGITEQALRPRRIYLKQRRPKSDYVHSLRRKMSSGFVRPTEMRLAIAFADLDDGVPVTPVIEPYLNEVALIREYARQRAGTSPVSAKAVLALTQRSKRAQAERDARELDLSANPDSVAACDESLAADARYDAENQRKVDAIRARHAHLMLVSTA